MRKIFIFVSILIILTVGVVGYYYPRTLWFLLFFGPVILLGIYDLFQPHHTILRNFPVIGHFRYFFEFISPELHQYFVESNTEGRPFTRLQRNYIYKRARLKLETHPFGTEGDVYRPGYCWLAHSMYPKDQIEREPRVHFGGKDCAQPYMASIFNVSAMSFGSLGMNAVMALNKGAKLGNFYQNTGEGGVSKYHLANGGDLVFQVGTAYFGCRDEKGFFSEKYFSELAQLPQVKMIELKLSQGAKPGLGGVLPASKNTPEIAEIRRLVPHQMVHSPPGHHTFSNSRELLEFITKLRRLSGGKPVGFKLCIGSRKEFLEICEAMVETGLLPDFITVDGGEGGTGAAPIEFSDNVGMPLDDALVFVCDSLTGYGLKKQIRVIASCKIITGFDIVKHMAIGADACNCARGMMFALGCIQALRCDSNDCPTGIATQDHTLQKGLVVTDKAQRVANYHNETVKSALAMLCAAGLDDPGKLYRSYIYKRVDNKTVTTLDRLYPAPAYGEYLENGAEHDEPGRHKNTGSSAQTKVNTQKKGRDYPSHTSENTAEEKQE